MATESSASMTQAEKVTLADELLTQAYGIRDIVARRDAMHELISTILSHRTTHANEETAYWAMRQRFVSWDEIRNAPLSDLEDAIKTSNYAEIKAPWIQKILTSIIAERGEANIDFLRDWPADQAMAWLMKLPGVGLKTATLLLLFNFQKPVLPVDTHVHRVTLRLGVLSPKTSAEKAHAVLLAILPREAKTLYNFHKHFYWHGQRVCFWSLPKCSQCILRDLCDYYHGTGPRL